MLRTIHLYNSLADNGRLQVVELDVDTPRLMFRGLFSVVDGFESRFRAAATDVNILTQCDDPSKFSSVAPESLGMTLGNTNQIHIVPAVAGGGPLIPLAVGAMGLTGMTATIVTAVLNIAVSMVLGAISSALAPKPDTSRGAAEKKPSFMFNGPINVTEQGYPVPLAYGLKVLTGSTVISVDADVVQLPT